MMRPAVRSPIVSRKMTLLAQGTAPTPQTCISKSTALQQVDDPGGALQDKLVAVKCTRTAWTAGPRRTAEPGATGGHAAKGPERRWRLVPSTLSPNLT